MSEYWKSNAKKFCEVCKVWFADNKISIEHHERGLKHKSMVQQRLREVSKREIQRERENDKLALTLAQMEQAAVKSMGGKSRGSGFSNIKIDGATIGPSIGATVYAEGEHTVVPQVEKLSEYEKQKLKVRTERERLKQLKRTAKESTIWKDDEEPSGDSVQKQDDIYWVKTVDHRSNEYYFNIYTQETTWTCPGKYYTLEEYHQIYPHLVTATTSSEAVTSNPVSSIPQQEFTDYYHETYEAPPPPPDVEDDNSGQEPQVSSIIPNKKSRMEEKEVENEEDDVGDQTDIMKPEVISKIEPEIHEQTIENEQKTSGLLGPWIPVVRKEEKPVVDERKIKELLDDLPEEAKQVKTLEPTFDEIEAEELTFEEKRAPITTKKSSKVIEFKKRKTGTNKNLRTRHD